MPNKKIKSKKGFTIIEVVLVLAIAGLIFLMVFIALPQLQKSQRDTQRRDDAARIATALTQYQTNNGGKFPIQSGSSLCYPEDAETIAPNNKSSYESLGSGTKRGVSCRFIAEYLNSNSSSTNEFVDPDGTSYGIRMYRTTTIGSNPIGNISASLSMDSYSHQFYIRFGTKCGDSEGTYTKTTLPGDYAIFYKLEGSGIYCIDNQ